MTESETPLDAERIFRALAEHEVDYVLIGGLAVQTHGHVRTTNDADLTPPRVGTTCSAWLPPCARSKRAC